MNGQSFEDACRDISVNPGVDCAEVHNAATTVSPAVQIIGIAVLAAVLIVITLIIVCYTKRAQQAIRTDENKIHVPDQNDPQPNNLPPDHQ